MDPFASGKTIIKSQDMLKPDNHAYKPDTLPEREKEMEELGRILTPIRSGETPHNSLVYGPTGQGKSVAIELKIEQLQAWAEANNRDVTPVHVRCKGCDSSYHVLTLLVKKLREIRYGPGEEKPQGHQRKTLVEMVYDELEEIKGTVVIVLDEIDGIGEDDYVLYELSRPNIENTKIGIIGITNDSQFRNNLDADVQSSLGDREIYFNPYDTDQLRNILSRRAAGALKDTRFEGPNGEDNVASVHENLKSEVLAPGVIPKIAAVAAQETGDARHAIRLLQRSCEMAEGDDGVVMEDHVEKCHQEIELKAVEQLIASETTQRKLTLASVIKEDLAGNDPVGTTDIYQTYCTFCEEIDVRVLSQRTFRDKLNDLVHSNILTKIRRGRGRGQGMSNFYALSVDRSLAIDSLSGDEMVGYIADILENMNK